MFQHQGAHAPPLAEYDRLARGGAIHMGKRQLRRLLAAAGVLTAGALSGCQTPGGQYAHAGVSRGDLMGTAPLSPAFAQVNAGRHLPPAGTTVGPAEMTSGSMPSGTMVMNGS